LAETELKVSQTEPPSVWAIVKASALRRLGKPLLWAYLVLLVFGVVAVAASLVLMRVAP
jgi:hypothetical protein